MEKTLDDEKKRKENHSITTTTTTTTTSSLLPTYSSSVLFVKGTKRRHERSTSSATEERPTKKRDQRSLSVDIPESTTKDDNQKHVEEDKSQIETMSPLKLERKTSRDVPLPNTMLNELLANAFEGDTDNVGSFTPRQRKEESEYQRWLQEGSSNCVLKRFVVAFSRVRVRKEPHLNAEVLRVLSCGAYVSAWDTAHSVDGARRWVRLQNGGWARKQSPIKMDRVLLREIRPREDVESAASRLREAWISGQDANAETKRDADVLLRRLESFETMEAILMHQSHIIGHYRKRLSCLERNTPQSFDVVPDDDDCDSVY